MKKLIYIILGLLLYAGMLKAQNPCVQVDCKDTIQLPADTISLNSIVSGTYSSLAWSQVAGQATSIDNSTSLSTVARGLKSGLYVFQLRVTNGNSATIGMDSVFVLPPACPVCPPIIPCPVVDSTGIGRLYMAAHPAIPRSFATITLNKDGTALVVYKDGTFETVTLSSKILIQ